MSTTSTPNVPQEILEALEPLDKEAQELIKDYIERLQCQVLELGGELPSVTSSDDKNSGTKSSDGTNAMDMNTDTCTSSALAPDYVSGDDYDKAADCKQQAADAKSSGDLDKALEYYNEAVQAAPPSALLYANRAMVLEKLGHYRLAEMDCGRALKNNPDSCKALKVRGLLRYQHLEDWHGALADLNQAQSMDYDPDVAAILKELTQKRIEEEKQQAQLRLEKEQKLKKKAQEIKQAQEEAKRAKAQEEAEAEEAAKARSFASGGGIPDPMGASCPMGSMGGMPGMGMGAGAGGAPGMGGMMDMLMKDPELQEAMKNPKVVAAFSELMNAPGGPMGLMANPAKLQELMGDPDVGPVLQKLMAKFMGGGGAAMPGGMPGAAMPGGMPGAAMPGGMPAASAGTSSNDGDDAIPDLGDLPDLD